MSQQFGQYREIIVGFGSKSILMDEGLCIVVIAPLDALFYGLQDDIAIGFVFRHDDVAFEG